MSYAIFTAMRKIKSLVYLTVEQKKALKRLSLQTGAPETEHVRRALDSYLKKRTRRP